MSYPINYPTPQGANVQIFVSAGGVPNSLGGSNVGDAFDWVKPQGASFVWFTLIGGGGRGNGSTGGGSGAVTNFMCPAFLIPNMLRVIVAPNNDSNRPTKIVYQQKDGTGYDLLQANSASNVTGGAVTGSTYFAPIGFYQNTAGADGSASTISASSFTFLSGGGAAASAATANYGYVNLGVGTDRSGFFMLQPIIVGMGGSGTGTGGIGCGGGSSTGLGGSGMAVIITW